MTDIGYGLRPEHPTEAKAKNADKAGASDPMTFEEYKAFVAEYTAEKVSKLSGMTEKQLNDLHRISSASLRE